MGKEVALSKWLQALVDQSIESEGWPDGDYPAVGFSAMEQVAEDGGDLDQFASLLQLVANEVERLRQELTDVRGDRAIATCEEAIEHLQYVKRLQAEVERLQAIVVRRGGVF